MNNKIFLSGDWHGNLVWASAVVKRAHALGIDTIYHVGDFGYMGRGGMQYTEQLSWLCEDLGVKIWITPGNHENWGMLDELFKEYRDEPAPIAENETIYMLPRGFRWERAGVTFMSLGGAPSIDRYMRVPNIDWWPTEAITQGDVIRATEDGYVDVMITHDAPVYPGKVYDIIYKNFSNSVKFWGQDVLEYCKQGHDLLNAAYESIMPKMLFHGHYHVWDAYHDEEHDSRIISLDLEYKNKNTVILDLDAVRDNLDNKVELAGVYVK